MMPRAGHASTPPRIISTALATLALLSLSACGQGASPDATAPSLDAPQLQTSLADTSAGPLGIWQLTGDLTTLDLTLTPTARQVNVLGDSFTVDVSSLATRFLRIDSITRPDADTVRVNFRFQHPFPDATARRDLHIFDVRLHALTPAAVNTFASADGLTAPTGASGAAEPIRMADLPVANASGWSTWGDEVVEPVMGTRTPNLYPYWRVHDAPAEGTFDPAAPSGWNVVPMAPTTYDIPIDLVPGSRTKLDLLVALEASYGQSAYGPLVTPLTDPGGRQNPRYFLPQFSLKEAWKATIAQSGSLTIGAAATHIDLALSIYDHQGDRAAVGAFDPLTAPQTSLRYASPLQDVTLAVPELLGTPITKTADTFTGNGGPSSPYTGTISLSGDQVSGAAGTYLGLVAIRDGHPASTFTLAPLGTLGVDRTLTPVERHDYTLYMPVSITAEVSANQAPTADVRANPLTVPNGGTTQLSKGPGCSDPDGSIVLYEFDFNYDGTFTVDASNTTGAAVTSPALTTAGIHMMAMRVTDNGNPALSAIDTVDITVQPPPNQAPTAELLINPGTVTQGQTVQCSPGPGTGDPDGTITVYQYDFDYDGTTFNVDATNTTGAAVTSPALSTIGTRTMAMKVFDDGVPSKSAVDTAQVIVQAPPNQPPTAVLKVTPATVESGQTVQCSPDTGTGDPDGSIVLYEYDFDYVGTTFTVDASNTTGAPAISPALTNTGASPIQRTTAIRVTDNGTPGLKTVDTAIVTINPAVTTPTWTEIYNLLRNGSGNGDESCYSCHKDNEGKLRINTDKQATYTELVNATADCGLTLVVPGSSATSFLYEKVTSTNPQCGDPMPVDAPRWSAAAKLMLKQWIDAGALNN